MLIHRKAMGPNVSHCVERIENEGTERQRLAAALELLLGLTPLPAVLIAYNDLHARLYLRGEEE